MRVSVQCDKGYTHDHVKCDSCGVVCEDNSNAGFWRMIPPLGSWNSASDVWICLKCLNRINAAFFGLGPLVP